MEVAQRNLCVFEMFAEKIQILVALDGKSYTVNGKRHEAFSDLAEKNGDDEGE